nr:unknown Function [uncultured bacterium]
MKGGDDTITTFNFHIIPLFQLKAEQYVHEHITCMYPLLPTMKGATHRLLKSAMKELAEKYKNDNDTLSDFFAYMVILLDRVETITPLEKARMKEMLSMYNNLWDQSPIVQRMKAASEAEGELKGLRRALVSIVQSHFPVLADLAKERTEQITDSEKLNSLLIQVSNAQDEESVRVLLAPTVA